MLRTVLSCATLGDPATEAAEDGPRSQFPPKYNVTDPPECAARFHFSLAHPAEAILTTPCQPPVPESTAPATGSARFLHRFSRVARRRKSLPAQEIGHKNRSF